MAERILPEDAIEERFLAATGPGGQNVNKVATAVQLRAYVFRLGLSPESYRRLKVLAGSRMTAAGELLIVARRYRTQEQNRADARARLIELLDRADEREARRRPTTPTRASKVRRMDAKKGRGAVKAGRGPVRID